MGVQPDCALVRWHHHAANRVSLAVDLSIPVTLAVKIVQCLLLTGKTSAADAAGTYYVVAQTMAVP